jgi:hypothetical protein
MTFTNWECPVSGATGRQFNHLRAVAGQLASALVTSFIEPDQGRLPAGLAFAAMGEVLMLPMKGALLYSMETFDAETPEARARKGREVRHVSPPRVDGERGLRARVATQERLSHLCADLEMRRSDRGSQPSQNSPRVGPKRSRRCFQDARRQAPPSGMRGSNHVPILAGEKDGQAIGRQDRTDPTELAGDGGIRHGAAGKRPAQPVQIRHLDSVHLAQPDRLRGQTRGMPQATPILGDIGVYVVHVSAEIQRLEGLAACAAGTPGRKRPYRWRYGPVRRDPFDRNSATLQPARLPNLRATRRAIAGNLPVEKP